MYLHKNCYPASILNIPTASSPTPILDDEQSEDSTTFKKRTYVNIHLSAEDIFRLSKSESFFYLSV